MKFIILIIVILMQITPVFASENERTLKAKGLIQQKMAQIHENKKSPGQKLNPIEISDEDLASADAREVLSFLRLYKNDTVWFAKQNAFRLEVRLATLHKNDILLRQNITQDIVDAFLDPNDSLDQHSYEWLLQFSERDIDGTSKEKLLNEFNRKEPSKELVKVVGVANITESLVVLEDLLIDEKAYQIEADKTGHPKWYLTKNWSARLARARMGVKSDINKCVSLIEQEIDANNTFRLFDDLGYIRQPEAIESLKKYFLSDLRLPQVKMTSPGEPYSQYLMPILEDNLANVPIQKNETKKRGRLYKKEEIEICRKWISEQTSWDIVR